MPHELQRRSSGLARRTRASNRNLQAIEKATEEAVAVEDGRAIVSARRVRNVAGVAEVAMDELDWLRHREQRAAASDPTAAEDYRAIVADVAAIVRRELWQLGR